jgi:hypothetical protein
MVHEGHGLVEPSEKRHFYTRRFDETEKESVFFSLSVVDV